jgi:hypothetical protein
MSMPHVNEFSSHDELRISSFIYFFNTTRTIAHITLHIVKKRNPKERNVVPLLL